MSSCKDTDALMMDWLYDELEPEHHASLTEHIDGCANCAAEIQSLRATRAMFADLPQVEPPPGLSAMLLQEAAKQAPRGDAAERRPGIWAWLSGLFQPLAAHPAAAALASLVLVAGVAGTLYVGGVQRASEPVHLQSEAAGSPESAIAFEKSDDTAAKNQPTAADTSKDRAAAESTAETPASDPAPVASPRSDRGDDRDRVGRVAESPESQSIVIDTATPELKDLPEEEANLASARQERARERRAEDRPAKSKKRLESSAKDVDRGKRDLSVADLLDDDVDGEGEVDETFAAPAPVVASGAAGGDAPADGVAKVRGRATQVTSGAEGRALERSGARSQKSPQSAPTARKPSPAPRANRRASSGKGSTGSALGGAPGQAPAKAGDKRAAPDDEAGSVSKKWTADQRRRLARAVRDRKCDRAARIANDIRDRDPRYYAQNIASSKTIAPCRTLVAKERVRRDRKRAAEKQAAEADAAEAESVK